MKKIIAFCLSICLLVVLCACGTTQGSSETSEVTSSVVEDVDSVTVTDMSGDKVTISLPVEKIVNLWPAGTSSFFVMGAGDLVSALAVNSPATMNSWTKFFYPGCADIPAMGGTDPSVEELMNLEPDLVIIHPKSASAGFAEQIREVGIPAININFSNYDEMIEAYTMLGEILGGEYQERLDAWCENVEETSDEISDLTKDLADEEKPVVLYIAGQTDSPTTTMSSGSICEDWTNIAGGIYATTAAEMPEATELTAEEIFKLDPDVIIVGGTYQHKLMDYIKSTDGWKDLKAVKDGRLYNNPFGCFNWDRFGLESLMQLHYAFMCIQPELAEEAGIDRDSMIQEVIDFYQMMNGTELTEEQAGYMLDGLNPEGEKEEPVATGGGGQGQGQGGGQGQSQGNAA